MYIHVYIWATYFFMKNLDPTQKELLEAIRVGDLGRVKYLINTEKVSPDFGYDADIMMNPIVISAIHNRYEIAKFLIDLGFFNRDVFRFVTNVVCNISVSNYLYDRMNELTSSHP